MRRLSVMMHWNCFSSPCLRLSSQCSNHSLPLFLFLRMGGVALLLVSPYKCYTPLPEVHKEKEKERERERGMRCGLRQDCQQLSSKNASNHFNLSGVPFTLFCLNTSSHHTPIPFNYIIFHNPIPSNISYISLNMKPTTSYIPSILHHT